MNLKYILTIIGTFLVVLTIACGNGDEESSTVKDPGNKLTVLATTPMLGEFVKQVAGENIEVEVLMPYAVDPHTFDPSPKDVKKINEADLVFYVGLKYETKTLTKLLQNSVQSNDVLIEIGSKINPIEFRKDDHEEDHDDHDDEEDHEDHDHEEDHEDHDDEEDHEDHDHGTLDPHFWFDPNRVALAVGEIQKQLNKLDPGNYNAYKSLANSYLDKLKTLDEEMDALIQTLPSDNREIVTTHESLGYLENRYGLEVLVTIIPNITTEDGVTPKQLVKVIEKIKDHEIKVIFIESESPSKSAEIIAKDTGVSLVSGLWVETLKENQSYIDFIKTNVELIVENLKK